jgi:serine/threonine-protein kinase
MIGPVSGVMATTLLDRKGQVMAERNFGRYEIIDEIGHGGMGTVYRARDTKMQRDVAVKVLRPELVSTPGYVERFRREAFTAASLSEPHVVPVYEADEIDGQLFIVMPLISGTDLTGVLNRGGAMAPELAVHVVEQVGAALDAAHAAGLVHRDVKPSNVLLTDKDFAYLFDFGIAHAASDTKLTSTGTTMGTWGYMAPERFTTGAADASVDIYALACVLYQCLTGMLPFPGESMPQQVHGHCYLEPPRPSAVNPALPAALDDVISRGMAKDPNARFERAADLAAAARRAISSATDSSSPPPMPETMPAHLYNEAFHRAETQAAQVAAGQHAVSAPVAGAAVTSSAGARRAAPSRSALVGGAAVILLGIGGTVLLVNSRGGLVETASQPSAAVSARTSPTAASPAANPATPTARPPTAVGPVFPGQQPGYAAAIRGTCDEQSCYGVQQRSEPRNSAPQLVPDILDEGSPVRVVCQTIGDLKTEVDAPASNLWYRLTNGAYINSIYITPPGTAIPRCA